MLNNLYKKLKPESRKDLRVGLMVAILAGLTFSYSQTVTVKSDIRFAVWLEPRTNEGDYYTVDSNPLGLDRTTSIGQVDAPGGSFILTSADTFQKVTEVPVERPQSETERDSVWDNVEKGE